jgi:hypothetical protein
MHSVKVVDNNTIEFRYYSRRFQKKTVTYCVEIFISSTFFQISFFF